jgi:hypothetical protein
VNRKGGGGKREGGGGAHMALPQAGCHIYASSGVGGSCSHTLGALEKGTREGHRDAPPATIAHSSPASACTPPGYGKCKSVFYAP